MLIIFTWIWLTCYLLRDSILIVATTKSGEMRWIGLNKYSKLKLHNWPIYTTPIHYCYLVISDYFNYYMRLHINENLLKGPLQIMETAAANSQNWRKLQNGKKTDLRMGNVMVIIKIRRHEKTTMRYSISRCVQKQEEEKN